MSKNKLKNDKSTTIKNILDEFKPLRSKCGCYLYYNQKTKRFVLTQNDNFVCSDVNLQALKRYSKIDDNRWKPIAEEDKNE